MSLPSWATHIDRITNILPSSLSSCLSNKHLINPGRLLLSAQERIPIQLLFRFNEVFRLFSPLPHRVISNSCWSHPTLRLLMTSVNTTAPTVTPLYPKPSPRTPTHTWVARQNAACTEPVTLKWIRIRHYPAKVSAALNCSTDYQCSSPQSIHAVQLLQASQQRRPTQANAAEHIIARYRHPKPNNRWYGGMSTQTPLLTKGRWGLVIPRHRPLQEVIKVLLCPLALWICIYPLSTSPTCVLREFNDKRAHYKTTHNKNNAVALQ